MLYLYYIRTLYCFVALVARGFSFSFWEEGGLVRINRTVRKGVVYIIYLFPFFLFLFF